MSMSKAAFVVISSILFLSACTSLPANKEALSRSITAAGGDANAYVTKNSDTLFEIAYNNRTDLYQELLAQGLKIEQVPYNLVGHALVWANYQQHHDILEMMLESGAPISAGERWSVETTVYGVKQPLSIAIGHDDTRLVQTLLKHGASVTNKKQASLSYDQRIYAAIQEAIKNNRNNAVQAFKAAGFGKQVAAVYKQMPTQAASNGGSGGGLFGSLAGAALGATVGGDLGNVLMLSAAEAALTGDDEPTQTAPVQPKQKVEEQSPEQKRDDLMSRVKEMMFKGAYAESLPLFAELDSLPVPLDPEVNFYWGKAFVETKQADKGLAKLYRYVQSADEKAPHYQEAQSLISRAKAM